MTCETGLQRIFNKAIFRGLAMALLATVLVLYAGLVQAQTVDDAKALKAALKSAQPGAQILLAPGNYGSIKISGLEGTAKSPVVIRSANPKKPARLARLDLREVSHIRFENLVFDYEFGTLDPSNLRPFQVFTSRNVTFRNNLFEGDLAESDGARNGYPTAFGLAITASTQITLEGNEIRDFFRGLVVYDVVDIKVLNNVLHAIRVDGMNFAQVENVLIEGNEIRDFKRSVNSNDHSDMIQFWTNRTKRPSRNIVIRGNVLNSGKGAYTQSIFMRNDLVDRGRAGPEMFYRNVTIEENVIINAHLHGITVGESNGLRIQRNTLVHNAASDGKKGKSRTVWIPQIRVARASKNVKVLQNIMPTLTGYKEQHSWEVADNVLIQDRYPSRAGYYDKIFLAARSGDPRNLANFTYIDPKVAARAGAKRLRGAQKSDLGLMPVISVTPGVDEGRFALSATRSQFPASASLEDAEITWHLGDEQIGDRAELDLQDLQAGLHDLTLRLALPDGQFNEAHLSLNVKGDDILRFGPGAEGIISYSGAEPKTLSHLPFTERGISFGRNISAWEIRSSDMTGFFETPAFQLYLRMYLPHSIDNIGGELLRVHQTLRATLSGRGGLEIRFNTQDERMRFTTPPLRRQPGDMVDLLLDYDSERGTMEVYGNGEILSRARVKGLTAPRNAWGLGFGGHLNNRKPASGEIVELVLSAPQRSQFKIRP